MLVFCEKKLNLLELLFVHIKKWVKSSGRKIQALYVTLVKLKEINIKASM
jgi:hypothetical protein